jgi:alkylation response protein AidB-like acyl-CoA dehydrogenase
MDFDFSTDQKLLQEQARKFLTERCPATLVRSALEGKRAQAAGGLWREITELGWLGTAIPEEYGGLGLSRIEICALAEELGRACAPLPFASTVYGLTESVLLAGSPEQKKRLLPEISAGELVGAIAFSEGARNGQSFKTQARVTDGKLTGTKLPVTDGDIAEVTVVIAQDGVQLSLFLVDLSQPGVERQIIDSIDPTRGIVRLQFDGVPTERLGAPGQGTALAKAIYDRMAVFVAFEQLGGSDRCLQMAREYAVSRYAFGRPIGSYQALKHKLAYMYVKNEVARSNAYFAAWALDTAAAQLPLAAAAARVASSDAYWYASKENIQTHGGFGFTWEADCHLYYRRARQLHLLLGAPRGWKEQVVSELEKQEA